MLPGMERTAGDVAELYERAGPGLVGLLRTIGGSRADAEEVAQEAFVRLIEQWPKIRTYDDPEAWVRTVAVRLLVSRHRRRMVALRAAPHLARRTRPPAEPSPDAVDLANALGRLPVSHRAVVLLHHLLEIPVEDVATQLRVPVGTVKSRLARARLALRPLLADEERSTP